MARVSVYATSNIWDVFVQQPFLPAQTQGVATLEGWRLDMAKKALKQMGVSAAEATERLDWMAKVLR